jgi:hypothetical protein
VWRAPEKSTRGGAGTRKGISLLMQHFLVKTKLRELREYMY